ncbi:MAG: carboxypeptidase regulatory-like domain-containing protein, partial [Planctomycetes bacterium]|nr:carboxypeptidase regulatory-like domain-containing protein [Planctomycetota bacterium]
YLFAEAPGYASGRSAPLSAQVGKDLDGIIIAMSKGATVKGRVTNSKGEPVSAARIELKPQMGPEGEGAGAFLAMFQNSMRTPSKTAVTDSEGQYQVENVSQGSFRLTASHPSYAAVELNQAIRVPNAGEFVAPDVALRVGGTLSGIVRDKEGKIAPQSRVEIRERGGFGGATFSAVSDAQGRYEIKNIRAGIYTIRCTEVRGEAAPLDLGALIMGAQGTQNEIVIGDGESMTFDVDA